MPAAREVCISTDRGRLHAKIWNGPHAAHPPPFVLFHDSLGCVALWRDFPEKLAAATERAVIAYDRLGFGKSDAHPGNLDFKLIRDEASYVLPALRKQFAFDQFIAFGHSVGGGMAIECAAAFPDLCVALITESAQTFVEDRTLDGIRDARRAFAQDAQVERLRKYHGDKAAWVLSAWVDTWLAPEFAAWNLDRALTQVRCPVLAIHGGRDEYGSIRHPERIAALANAPVTLKILAQYGHVPHREAESAVLEWVANFVGSLTR